MGSKMKGEPMTADLRHSTLELRHALVALHRDLVETARIRYERAQGRPVDPVTLLRLLTDDVDFAWLRPLSTLIVELDERFADAEQFADADVVATAHKGIAALFAPGGKFWLTYATLLQEDAAAAVAHGRVRAALARLPAVRAVRPELRN
jgi:hypothetical protein